MEINHMEYLSLSGVLRLWNNIKTYINKEFNIFKSGSAGLILTSDGNGGIEWKTQALATITSAGLMSPDDKSKLENLPYSFELILNGSDYDTIINADGLVNSGDLLTTCNFTKAEYKNIANDIKFIRISNNDNTRSTLFNVSFCMPEYSIICGYCFNKLNDTLMGVGYVTIRYDGSGKNLKIAAIRSTMPIDGTGDDFNTLVNGLENKVDKIYGKGLSTYDFTYDYKNKLDNLNDNINVPTKTSLLTNDSGYITSSSIPTKVSLLTNDSGYVTSSNIPTKTSDLTNNSGFITASDVNVPTKTSLLTNDSKFVSIESSDNITNIWIGSYDEYTNIEGTQSNNTIYIIKEKVTEL